MTPIEELRRDHDRFCASMAQALADARRALRAMAADDDDPPFSPNRGARPRSRPLERSRTRFGLEHNAVMPAGLEYRHAGKVERVA